MTKVIAQTYNITNEYRARITVVLLAACLCLAFLYAMNVYTVIARTVAIGHIESQETALARAVSSLNGRYLDLSSNVTPDKIASYGLAEGQVSQFIERDASLGRVALRGNEF